MTSRPAKLYLPAIGAIVLFAWSGVSSARTGLARLMSDYASGTSSVNAAQRALELNPNDAEAHSVLGKLYAGGGDSTQALLHFERAATLRPNDYFFWFELGRLQDENNESDKAITSLRRAVELAPSYSQPRWLLGNVLLRSDQTEAGFVELRAATVNDQTLFPQLVELAWAVFEEDAQRLVQILKPESGSERIELARFLIKHDRVEEGIALLANAQDVVAEARRAIVADLIAVQNYQAARKLSGPSCEQTGLCNSGFEDAILTDEAGFGWRPTKPNQAVKVQPDTTQPGQGQRSLRIEYAGNFDETTFVISQLVPVASQQRYRLTWKSRTEALASAGLPAIAILDAGDSRELARSESIGKDTTGWSSYSVEFETASGTKAVKVEVQRAVCSVKPCPISGRAWFDQFELSALN